MEIRNVYIIINLAQYSRLNVVNDLKEECYKHNFMFANNLSEWDIMSGLAQCDEVWCFGDCSEITDYKVAKECRCDIWQMK